MNTTELSKAVAEETDLTQAQAKKALQVVSQKITEALETHDRVQLHGLGVFKTKQRSSRKLNSLMGGGTKPAHIAPVFTPSKKLKDAVNG